jgi:outer membrane protein TolC
VRHAFVVRYRLAGALQGIVLLAAAAFQPIAAQEGAAPQAEDVAPADLAGLIEEALSSNASLKAASSRLQAAQSLASLAQAPPDPEVSVAYVNDGVSSFTLGESEFATLSLTWTQEVPYPGKLRSAGDVALREGDLASRELDRARLSIASQVKIAYADLYRLDRTSAILEETRAVLESLSQTAARRYEVGQGIQENVLKSQTEVLRVEAELLRVRQERKASEARLNAAVGRSGERPVGPATSLPEASLPEDPGTLADRAVASSPEIAVLAATVRRQEAGAQLAELGLKPDFLWSASYVNRGGLDPMIAASFGVRLPLHRERKQSQALLQADLELQAAHHDLKDGQTRTRASVQELVSRAERAERLADLYEQGVIPQARGALESAQASYAVGRIALLDVLGDVTVLLEARRALADEESDRLQALAALEPLVAMELVRTGADLPGGGDRDASSR